MSKQTEKDHPIQKEFGAYGLIDTANDPAWISPHLQEIHDDAKFALHQFSSTIDNVKNLPMGDYKPEIARAKRAEMILKSKRALLSFLKKHIQKRKSDVEAIESKILRLTQPESPSDPTKALLMEMRFKEIRDNLKAIHPKNRRGAVEGNLERMQAILSNPDSSDLIIDPAELSEMRRAWAFKADPTLIDEERTARQIYRAVRKRAGEISGTATKMLLWAKEADPMTEKEFYETFTPETDYEKEIVARRIRAEEKRQAEAEQKKLFEEQNRGINLGVQERVERLAKGIPH